MNTHIEDTQEELVGSMTYLRSFLSRTKTQLVSDMTSAEIHSTTLISVSRLQLTAKTDGTA